jgi:hypothetical protein
MTSGPGECASIDQMKLPSFLALNANDRAISRFHVGLSIKGYLDRKVPRLGTSKDLNASNGLTTGPLSDSLKALFPQSRVVEADCAVMKAHHAGIRIWRPLATRRKALMNRDHGGSYPANYGYSARLPLSLQSGLDKPADRL